MLTKKQCIKYYFLLLIVLIYANMYQLIRQLLVPNILLFIYIFTHIKFEH